MKESFRCAGCKALLFKAIACAIAGIIEIKCRRCRQFNSIRPVSHPTAIANRATERSSHCGPIFPLPA
ncbi:Com family DNA-binding transcriptional regulator [Sphingomonas sp.]|uniref:Com family DNA-binding transcriptional regulator n=1 Tax=Sphingomonas sp. TaxID=28214 RepID=UPI003BA976C6